MLAETGYYLGIGMVNLIQVLNPQVLVIGQGSPGLMAVPPETRGDIWALRSSVRGVLQPSDEPWVE